MECYRNCAILKKKTLVQTGVILNDVLFKVYPQNGHKKPRY